MADDPTKHAIDVVAHQVIVDAVRMDIRDWEDYPEIGEFDWKAVQDRVAEIAAPLKPDRAAYEAAYEHLEHRADL